MPNLDSFLVVYFQRRLLSQWGPHCCTFLTCLWGSLQCAVMPNNFIFLGLEFLIATCMSKTTYKDHADQWPFQVYVNSFLALLNAQYYLQPSDSGVADISKLRAHRPSPYHGESEAENVQGSQMNVYKHPYDHDHELHATRPVQAVMVSSWFSVDRRWLIDVL